MRRGRGDAQTGRAPLRKERRFSGGAVDGRPPKSGEHSSVYRRRPGQGSHGWHGDWFLVGAQPRTPGSDHPRIVPAGSAPASVWTEYDPVLPSALPLESAR